MDLGLTGRVAIVTGASSGIGRAIALRLAREGTIVLLVARGAEALETVAGEITEAGGRAEVAVADLTDPMAATTVVERCTRLLGGPDILVNNAGGGLAKPLEELEDADWREGLELNFLAAARLSVSCAPVMREAHWGRMVHVSSTSGTRPDVLFAPYSAAKAALMNLSVALSVELAPHGVLSNTVTVGVTETELVRSNAAASAVRRGISADEVMSRMLARTDPPSGRFGTPEEIAAAVAFLAGEPASWITGANLAVDGGTLRAI